MGEMQISANQARDLTDRIKVGVEAIWDLVKQAYVSRAWSVLGYDSWDDYCTREFGTSRIKLPREERQEVVSSMREIGMSTRAIASATGTGIGTVHRELSRVPNGTPESEPAPVTGTDGKTYTPRPASQPPRPEPSAQLGPDEEIPTTTIIGTDDLAELNAQTPTPEPEAKEEPPKPRRTPITESALSAVFDLDKAINRLESITKDDRFPKNKTQIRDSHISDLGRAQEALNSIIQNISE